MIISFISANNPSFTHIENKFLELWFNRPASVLEDALPDDWVPGSMGEMESVNGFNGFHPASCKPNYFKDKQAINMSSLVYPDKEGHLVYRPYTDKGDRILDFSYCGFKRSEERIPEVAIVATVSPLQGEPVPEGTMAYPKGPDSRAHIQNALDNAGGMQPGEAGFRGAVLLKKGTYYVNGSLMVPSGVVLRGEGDGPNGSVLIFRNPRGTAIEVGNPGTRSVSTGEPTKISDEYIPAGSMQVHVEDAEDFYIGDYINIRKITNEKWIEHLGMDRLTEIDPENSRVRNWNFRSYQFDHIRKINQLEGNRITLDAPLPQSISSEFGGGTVEKVSLAEIDSLCGVESLCVISNYDTSFTTVFPSTNKEYFSDEKHNLKTGISLNCRNGWVRNCTVMHTRFGAVTVGNQSRYCTVRNCKSLKPVSNIYGGRRYPFMVGGGSMSLFYNCYSEEGRHDFAVSSRVTGPHAFVKCNARKSTSLSEPHHRWSSGILYDNITLKEGGGLAIKSIPTLCSISMLGLLTFDSQGLWMNRWMKLKIRVVLEML